MKNTDYRAAANCKESVRAFEYSVDASDFGYGVCHTGTSVGEIRREAPRLLLGWWHTAGDRHYSSLEKSEVRISEAEPDVLSDGKIIGVPAWVDAAQARMAANIRCRHARNGCRR